MPRISQTTPLRRLRDNADVLRRRFIDAPFAVRVLITLPFIAFLYGLPFLKLPVLNTPDSAFSSVLFYPVGMYVLLALGLNVVVGLAGLLDLGYVAFFAIGGYAMALLGVNAGWTFYEILPVAVAVSMVAGVILGSPTLRLRGDYLAIVTLGFGEIVRETANNSRRLGGPRGIFGIPHPSTTLSIKFSLLNPKPYYWLLLTLIVLIVFVVHRLEHSRVGRAWTAIREDEDAAELMGVPTFKFKLWAFAIGAAIGGMGGCVYASQVVSITPDNYTLILSILILAAVVLGGAGNMPGVIVGAILVAYLPERFRTFNEARVMIFGAALVATMIFRPQGLFPSRQRASELTDNVGLGGMGSLGGELGHLSPREVGEDV